MPTAYQYDRATGLTRGPYAEVEIGIWIDRAGDQHKAPELPATPRFDPTGVVKDQVTSIRTYHLS